MDSKMVASPHWWSARVHSDAVVREYCTIHTCVIAAGARVLERNSLRRCIVRRGAFINAGCYIENVVVGRRAQIGANCSIVGVWHQIDERGPHLAHADFAGTAIHIGADVLIGAGCVVVPGVRIGARTIIGAGSLVTKDLAADKVYIGCPPHPTLMTREEYLMRKAK